MVRRDPIDGTTGPNRWYDGTHKPGNPTERRGLNISTLFDRARQALAKLLLKLEWEARFEPHSYGFRPGRSAHDAIEAIFLHVSRKPKYVLDADISKCFDRIDHMALLCKLHTSPPLPSGEPSKHGSRPE